jgi:hypothetical protein
MFLTAYHNFNPYVMEIRLNFIEDQGILLKLK